jgi:hypothetical protein
MNKTPILLFLDFDGVLHPLFSSVEKQFEKIFKEDDSVNFKQADSRFPSRL